MREHAAINAPGAPVERLIDTVWALDRADDAAEVARLSASGETV